MIVCQSKRKLNKIWFILKRQPFGSFKREERDKNAKRLSRLVVHWRDLSFDRRMNDACACAAYERRATRRHCESFNWKTSATNLKRKEKKKKTKFPFRSGPWKVILFTTFHFHLQTTDAQVKWNRIESGWKMCKFTEPKRRRKSK